MMKKDKLQGKKDYLSYRTKALQQYEIAYHLLNVTFPLVKDPKLLVGVMQNIFNSLEFGVEAILDYEKQLGLVPDYHFKMQSKLDLFKLKSAKRHNIPQPLIDVIFYLHNALEMHKKSPMAFQRGNKFVVCTHDYQMQTISIDDIKDYLEKNRKFLSITDTILRLK